MYKSCIEQSSLTINKIMANMFAIYLVLFFFRKSGLVCETDVSWKEKFVVN